MADEVEMKTCNTCHGTFVRETHFNKHNSFCKQCQAIWRKNHKAKLAKQGKTGMWSGNSVIYEDGKAFRYGMPLPDRAQLPKLDVDQILADIFNG